MKGKDFIQKFILQKVNINIDNKQFGEGKTKREKKSKKKFCHICLDNCTEDQRKMYTDPKSPDKSNSVEYQLWERQLKNFASLLQRKCIEKYIPLFDNTVTGKRSINKQVITVGTLFDTI